MTWSGFLALHELQILTDQMLVVFSDAQKLRSEKSQWINDTLEWILYERGVMVDAVNRVRLMRNQPLVSEADVRRVEQQATGQCDYSRKFALYCAELALQT